MNQMTKVRILGVPSDLGANMRGANLGPSALRIAGLHEKIKNLGYGVEDFGDLAVPVRETLALRAHEEKFRQIIAQLCADLESKVKKALDDDRMPLVLGGDHSIAIGTIAGAASYCRSKNQNLGLVWVDAHADINTPQSTISHNIHGMPLSIILGNGFPELTSIGFAGAKVKPENLALIGIRMLDGAERDLLRKSGVRYFTMREVDERGMAAVMNEAIDVAGKNTLGIHLSFDLDGVDPLYAPGVSTPVTGGLSYREAHLALEMLADTKKLLSMEFVEFNPMQDIAHKTGLLTTELIQSALGKSIV